VETDDGPFADDSNPNLQPQIATGAEEASALRGVASGTVGAVRPRLRSSVSGYRSLIADAAASLDPGADELRRAFYERARTALARQLKSRDPPLAESEIEREMRSLEEAVREAEADAIERRQQAPLPNSPARKAEPERLSTSPKETPPGGGAEAVTPRLTPGDLRRRVTLGSKREPNGHSRADDEPRAWPADLAPGCANENLADPGVAETDAPIHPRLLAMIHRSAPTAPAPPPTASAHRERA